MIPDRVHDGGFDVIASRKAPWPKACHDCALRRSDPQGIGAEAQKDVLNMVAAGQLVFYCLHRTDEGRHRVCASAAAVAKGRGRQD